MSSASNIAWGKRDAHGWTCPCGERLSIMAAPDTRPYELHCKGKRHGGGIVAATGHQTSMMRFFGQCSQGSQPWEHNSSAALQPSNDPSSPHSGASIEPLVELPVSCPVPTTCMGVPPLGVSSALVLRGLSHDSAMPTTRSTSSMLIGLVVSRVPLRVPVRLGLMNQAILYLASYARHFHGTAGCVNGCARNTLLIPALCIGSWAS